MGAKRIVVLGGGFAGLWSAAGAARKVDELRLGPEEVEITLVNRDAFHCIRVRNYEADLAATRVPLDDVLGPIAVRRVEGSVSGVDVAEQTVAVQTAAGLTTLAYDRLIFALGSQLARPNLPGLAEFGFDVDTYDGAMKLHRHLESLAARGASPGRFVVVVVGAGLTGIEVATEMPERLRGLMARAGVAGAPRVILADHNPLVGSDMGDSARPVIEEALRSLVIESRVGIEVSAIDAAGVRLTSGEEITADTVVWCAGMRAHPLTRLLGGELDPLGRIAVDEFLRAAGVKHVFAAGDVARARLDEDHLSVMSCQHGRPMGRFAGHNAVCDLLGLPMLPLHIDWYVTVLDLGPWGAVYTEGWDRQVVAQGAAAKQTKRTINRQRIYPPVNRDRQAILAAAEPVVQRPPTTKRS